MPPIPFHRVRPLCLCLALASPAAFGAPIAWDALDDDWHTTANWQPQQVPTAADDATINNGGTANAGLDATVRSLQVGAADTGGNAVSGFVNSVLSALRSVFDTRVGVAGGDVPSATGGIAVAGGPLSANAMTVGGVSASSVAGASGTGTVAVTGGPLTANALFVGSVSGGTGATADGAVSVTGGELTATPRIGVAFGSDAATHAVGRVKISGGDLHLNAGNFEVGRNFGGESSAEGHLEVSGAITTSAPLNAIFPPSVAIGLADSGHALGAVTAGAIDTSINPVGDVSIGRVVGSTPSAATASGELTIGSGTLRSNGSVDIGSAVANGARVATGVAHLSGVQVSGDGTGSFTVGHALAAGLIDNVGTGSASGSATVAGVDGFASYRVGVAQGTVLNDVSASGTLAAGSGGIVGNGSSTLRVGISEGLPNNGQVIGSGVSASGHVSSQGDVTGFASISVGAANHAGTGSGHFESSGAQVGATGNVEIGIASSSISASTTPGSNPTAVGTAQMTGGSLQVGNALVIGRASVLDSSATPAVDPVRATGQLSLDQVTLDAPGAALIIGNASSGFGNQASSHAEGRLLATGGSLSVGNISVAGSAGRQGSAVGEMHLDGTDLAAQSLSIATGSGASGLVSLRNATAQIAGGLAVTAFNALGGAPTQGVLALDGVSMQVGGDGVVGPGFQGGSGELRLVDSRLSINGGLRIGLSSNLGALFGQGLVSLERSLAEVGELLFLDVGATLDFAVHGFDRGTGYGAFDVNRAVLDGDLLVDLSTLGVSGPAQFDLIVSALADGIDGMFASQSILGLGSGLVASTAIVSDFVDGQLVEIFRLTIAEAKVPEPGSLALVALALSLLLARGMAGRRRAHIR